MVQNIQKMITIRNLENEKKMIDNNIEFEDPQDEEIIQLVNRTVYLRSIKWVPFTVFIVSFFLTYVFVTIYLKETVPLPIGGTQTTLINANELSNNTNNVNPAVSPSINVSPAVSPSINVSPAVSPSINVKPVVSPVKNNSDNNNNPTTPLKKITNPNQPETPLNDQ